MPGPRQPTDLVKARGKKHFSQTEEDQRRDQEVHVQPPDRAEPPRWLGKKFHAEFREIGEILGISQGHTVVVLGAGNLGRALMENFKFASNGFQLLAAFDVGESVVGTTIGGVNVYHVDQLEEYLSAHKVSVGLLTLPQRAAQGVADRLVAGGVRGIWNFTNREISVSRPDVAVENVHFSDSLLTLSYLITQREEREEET